MKDTFKDYLLNNTKQGKAKVNPADEPALTLPSPNIFSFLCTKEGFKSFSHYATTYCQGNDYFHTIRLLSSILNKYTTIAFEEILTLLDGFRYMHISICDIYMLSLFISAKEEYRLCECLFLHGATLFNAVSCRSEYISVERMQTLGRILAFKESVLIDQAMKLGYNQEDMMSCDDFMLYYYGLFHQIETAITQTIPGLQGVSKVKPTSSCCDSKVCHIT